MNNRVKYPRTFHLPYSLTITDDDKRLPSDDIFNGMTVVVTEKRDGENTTVYPDGFIHARSLDRCKHPWQTWMKKYVQSWCRDIPDGWRICGENLYPCHSISYKFNDESEFFQVFGVYDDNNICLDWNTVCDTCEIIGISHVPVIYIGKYEKETILGEFKKYQENQENEVEGFVVRNASSFSYDEFSKNVGKYVRANHVQTDEHWTKNWKPNEIVNKEK